MIRTLKLPKLASIALGLFALLGPVRAMHDVSGFLGRAAVAASPSPGPVGPSPGEEIGVGCTAGSWVCRYAAPCVGATSHVFFCNDVDFDCPDRPGIWCSCFSS